MPLFKYRGLSEQGSAVSGEAVATSIHALAHELAQRGVLVESIRPAGGRLWVLRRRKVGPEALLLFVQELIAMLRAGLRLGEVLQQVRERPGQPALSRTLARVEAGVRQGRSLSGACGEHPDVFDPLFVAAIRTGERTGDLVKALNHYQTALKRRIQFARQLGQAMVYPLFLVITLLVVLGLLFTLVLPRFVEMYLGSGVPLPWPTRVLMTVVNGLPLYGSLLIGMAAALYLGYRRWVASAAGRVSRDALLGRLPWIGRLLEAHGMAQMGSTLAALLSSGMPLVDALRATEEVLQDRARAARLAEATRRVSEGSSLADALSGCALVPPSAARMIAAGEASGSLDAALDDAAAYFEEVFTFHVARASALIEPTLMLLMGVIVGGVIVVMYLPIFNMASVIQ
jgi:type IV pilus assembly protein PilC